MSRPWILLFLLILIPGCLSQDAPPEDSISPPVTTPLPSTAAPVITEPPLIYKDASIGSHGAKDMVSYMGINGIIILGEIENGAVTTPALTITDDVGITLMSYSRQTVSGRGEVEMTIFYQERYVTIGINGTDTGYRLRYDKWKGLDDYLLILDNHDSPTFANEILERP